MIDTTDALDIVLKHSPAPCKETIKIHESIGRILAEKISADRAFPPFDRVTMDGIAISYNSFNGVGTTFVVESIGAAGSPKQTLKDTSKCIEIMTGAPLPTNTDTVIRYEDLEEVAHNVYQVNIAPIKRSNIHPQGRDHVTGEILLGQGHRLKAIDINLLATVGKENIEVYRNPRVAVISTGDELVPITETPKDYQIRRSNVFMIQARLTELGVPSAVYHIVDDAGQIRRTLEDILTNFDVLCLSGGVSKGKYDYIPEVLDQMGFETLFHRVRQRPGKPFWFGQKGDKTIFAFPGNPVSTLACFHKYFIPWWKKSINSPHNHFKVRLKEDISFKPDLTYFAQATIVQDEKGTWWAKVSHGNGSGDLVNPTKMHGFVELPAGKELFREGEVYNFIKFYNE